MPYPVYYPTYYPQMQNMNPGYSGYQMNGYNSMISSAPAPQQNYMINVDGEGAAKAWQMPNGMAPNTIIPLWDVDGEHVYFKSVDSYGRLNPLRKGRVVFEEEQANLPQGQQQSQDMSNFVTKDDLNSLKQDIQSMLSSAQSHASSQNQNGSRNYNRGEGK